MGTIRASRKKLPCFCKRNDQMTTSALLSDGPCDCEQFYHVKLQHIGYRDQVLFWLVFIRQIKGRADQLSLQTTNCARWHATMRS